MFSLGRTNLDVFPICLGGNVFGWTADEQQSRDVLDAYTEAGGNFVDTANRYTNGTSERLVGEFVAGERERFVVATKFTLNTREGDPNASGNHRKNMVQALERSLRTLGTGYVDVYWVHLWDPLTPIDEMMRALDDQVRLGKVLYLGISDAPAWVVARANTLAEERGWTPFSAVQMQYSLVERNVERELLPMSQNLDVAFTAWGALGAGVLSGKYNDDPTGGGGRIYSAGWGGLSATRVAVAREVAAVADEVGATPAQVALAWVRSRGAMVIPIVGASKLTQLQDNLGCVDVTLSDDQCRRLEAANPFTRGFPYDFASGGRSNFMGRVTERIDDHRGTAF